MYRLTSHTAKGRREYQEDRIAIAQQPYGVIAGVCDGHGGFRCATEAAQMLVDVFLQEMHEFRHPRLALEYTVTKIADKTKHYADGSTLSVVFVNSDFTRAYCTVIGDSPIIIRDKTGKLNVSPEHNVRSNPAEAAAASKRGGFIVNGYLSAEYYGPGLQMTRALGDVELDKVLSRVPDIYEVELGPESYVIVASDGVLDPAHINGKTPTQDIFELVAVEKKPISSLNVPCMNLRQGTMPALL